MVTIYKFPVEITDHQTIEMFGQFKILHAGEQNGSLFIWALVDNAQPKVDLEIKVIGTGHPVDYPKLQPFTFLNTVQMTNGLVFHIFHQ